MNILPKKRWHVRTKDNIARVRRDEAQAAEEEKERQSRVKLAEQEARMSLLRGMASNRMTEEQKEELKKLTPTFVPEKPAETSTSDGHVNFFSELEAGEDTGTTSHGNKDREIEKKKEQEDYEKKIGLLTYLGQDTNELTGEKSWWQQIPEDRKRKRDEAAHSDDESDKNQPLSKHSKLKDSLDPLNTVRRYLGTEGIQNIIKKSSSKSAKLNSSKHKHKQKKKKSKSKKSKKSKSKKKKKYRSDSDSESDTDIVQEKVEKQLKLEKLREERLKREEKERDRANHVLYGTPLQKTKVDKPDPTNPESARKYNSQFNPHIAKQNKLNANEKYWLN